MNRLNPFSGSIYINFFNKFQNFIRFLQFFATLKICFFLRIIYVHSYPPSLNDIHSIWHLLIPNLPHQTCVRAAKGVSSFFASLHSEKTDDIIKREIIYINFFQLRKRRHLLVSYWMRIKVWRDIPSNCTMSVTKTFHFIFIAPFLTKTFAKHLRNFNSTNVVWRETQSDKNKTQHLTTNFPFYCSYASLSCSSFHKISFSLFMRCLHKCLPFCIALNVWIIIKALWVNVYSFWKIFTLLRDFNVCAIQKS